MLLLGERKGIEPAVAIPMRFVRAFQYNGKCAGGNHRLNPSA